MGELGKEGGKNANFVERAGRRNEGLFIENLIKVCFIQHQSAN